jgi:hypothetical protein
MEVVQLASIRSTEKWTELATVLAVATAAALCLVMLGLSEVVWTPFFIAAVLTGSRRCEPARRGAVGD